jgi:hypothetical protein
MAISVGLTNPNLTGSHEVSSEPHSVRCTTWIVSDEVDKIVQGSLRPSGLEFCTSSLVKDLIVKHWIELCIELCLEIFDRECAQLKFGARLDRLHHY